MFCLRGAFFNNNNEKEKKKKEGKQNRVGFKIQTCA